MVESEFLGVVECCKEVSAYESVVVCRDDALNVLC